MDAILNLMEKIDTKPYMLIILLLLFIFYETYKYINFSEIERVMSDFQRKHIYRVGSEIFWFLAFILAPLSYPYYSILLLIYTMCLIIILVGWIYVKSHKKKVGSDNILKVDKKTRSVIIIIQSFATILVFLSSYFIGNLNKGIFLVVMQSYELDKYSFSTAIVDFIKKIQKNEISVTDEVQTVLVQTTIIILFLYLLGYIIFKISLNWVSKWISYKYKIEFNVMMNDNITQYNEMYFLNKDSTFLYVRNKSGTKNLALKIEDVRYIELSRTIEN